MRVCFVLENFYPYIGGAETLFKQYTTRLAEAGCKIKVMTSNSGGVNGVVCYNGVEVHHFPWRGMFGHPVPNPKDLRESIEWSDVVHTATLTAAPVAVSLANKHGKPCLITVHEVWANKWFWIEQSRLRAALYYLSERYILTRDYSLYHANSASTQKELVKCGIAEKRIITISPGVDKKASPLNARGLFGHVPQPTAASAIGAKTFLYFGRPGKPKGVFILVEAIRAIRDRLPKEFSFTFILSNNPRSEKSRLRRLIQKYALDDLIAVKNPLPEEALRTAIQSAYCVIVPSITEGFGLSAAESCALGRPVIVSDAGALPEVVFGKVLFFQNRNSADLASKILLATKAKFEFIPEKTFDWRTSIRQLLGVYRGLTEDHQPGQGCAGVRTRVSQG